MDIALLVIGLYFGLGLLSLAILDLLTRRIRRRLLGASLETWDRLVASGNIVSPRVALMLICATLWLFWPFVIYAAISNLLESVAYTTVSRLFNKDSGKKGVDDGTQE